MLEMRYEIGPLAHHIRILKDDTKVILLSLFVDDILIESNCLDIMDKIKEFLKFKFEMKTIDETTYALDINI